VVGFTSGTMTHVAALNHLAVPVRGKTGVIPSPGDQFG
jgi:hypothetical protein